MQGLFGQVRFHAASLLLPLLLGNGLSAQDYSLAIQAARTAIETKLKAYDSPGVSFAFVDGNHIAWSGSFGLADRDKHIPVSSDTLFELGSISKIFTCIAIMQLLEQKKLDIDKPYIDYVPEFSVKSRFPAGKEAITIRMLMTHHSGLVTDDDPWETTHPERYFYRALLDHLKGTSLLFPPGQRWHYSTFGINLLGLLVERVSGMDYCAYMNKQVLGPLDMSHASFDFQDLPAERIATAYFYNPLWDRIPKDEIRPAGSLRASMTEASHLISMLFNRGEYGGKRILSEASVDEMLRIQDDENPLDQGSYMGLGLRARYESLRVGSMPSFGHGGMARHRSVLALIPAWKVGFIASVNDYNAKDVLLWDPGEALFKGIFSARGETYGYVQPIPARLTGAAKQRDDLAGEYASIFGYRTLQATPEGALVVSASGFSRSVGLERIFPLTDGTFASENGKQSPFVFSFKAAAEGEIPEAIVRSEGKVVNRWQKLAPLPSPAGDRFEGRYEPVDRESRERTGIPEIQLCRQGPRLLVQAASTASREGDLPREYANAPFPLRFLDESHAEVINGALSGYDGYLFEFVTTPEGLLLKLRDSGGTAVYRKL